MDRLCSRCGVAKPIGEFGLRYPARGSRNVWCRSCSADYKREWYRRYRTRHIARVRLNRVRAHEANGLRLWQYLTSHPCVDCGETDPIVLDFDHLRDKTRAVTEMLGRGVRWSNILEEIEKCAVRCSNCHRRKTARENGHFRHRLASQLGVAGVSRSSSSG